MAALALSLLETVEELDPRGVVVVREVGVEPQTGPGVGQVVGLSLGANIPELAVVSPLDVPHQVHHCVEPRLAERHVLDDGQPGPPELLQLNSQSDGDGREGGGLVLS